MRRQSRTRSRNRSRRNKIRGKTSVSNYPFALSLARAACEAETPVVVRLRAFGATLRACPRLDPGTNGKLKINNSAASARLSPPLQGEGWVGMVLPTSQKSQADGFGTSIRAPTLTPTPLPEGEGLKPLRRYCSSGASAAPIFARCASVVSSPSTCWKRGSWTPDTMYCQR